MNLSEISARLTDLLDLTEAPVAITFDATERVVDSRPSPQPAGCCFWEPAQQTRITTQAVDHAHCSVGSYTHGFIPLATAASGVDTAALVTSGWVGTADLVAAPALPFVPSSITYQPLAESTSPDVVLVRLSSTSLMTLMGAVPRLALTGKPQCTIVPLAQAGTISVSPGCAVSRTRTNLPADAMTCAIPASDLQDVLDRLEASTTADRVVSAFAADDLNRNFAHA